MNTAIKYTGLALFLGALLLFNALLFMTRHEVTDTALQAVVSGVSDPAHQSLITDALKARSGAPQGKWAFLTGLNSQFQAAGISKYSRDEYLFSIAKHTATGVYWDQPFLFFILIVLVGALGALIYMIPAFFDGMPGIKHNGLYFNSATNQGLIGILAGTFLIGFYILLYFYHWLIAEWITLVDPVAQVLRHEPASKWFMYGFLYSVAITVMGVRMFAKYRHSAYQRLRTASVMFFQLCFAFILPQILYQLHLPEDDLKNIWPLNYYFFFDWNIAKHIDSGAIGTFMLVWGIILAAVGVPLMTFFFGKRWYCSWVCGCGGLAETAGDPFRHLSDKSLSAWKIERWMIHSVLVFAVAMTALLWINVATNQGVLHAFSQSFYKWYAFLIGSAFSGVVGVGFYPLLGSRVWCRFGCPMAAWLGLWQKKASRFRITVNGGQCISCGNCSTYCEMGIDVRHYAQRGQDVVRASCVGCGLCAAVCPRGVLRLENAAADAGVRTTKTAITYPEN
ncbi:MAG: 4Fe-4S dicluster-binding protein [Saprospiraceae bacterium]|nr:4Fe-4S dicluster-binding protein [Saprospiraceae bacterium]